VAGKDEGGRSSKTPASKTVKEKRQSKKDKKAAKGTSPTLWGRSRRRRSPHPSAGVVQALAFGPGQTLPLLGGEAPAEGVGLGVLRVGGGAPDVDGGG